MYFEIIYILKIVLKVYVLFTFLNSFIKKVVNNKLILILLFSLLNILISSALIYINIKIAFINNLYIICSFVLWLSVLKDITKFKRANYFLLVFILFSVFNLFFYENFNELNTKTFVFGTLLYLLLFVYVSYTMLKNERLDFFIDNNFILISSPILFFVGYSLMFGFKNKFLNNIILFNEVKLFDIISNFVNFTFYTLINLYIYKERSLKNV